MKRVFVLLAAMVLGGIGTAYGEVANIKVVTDASPDYTDMASLVHSTTSRWEDTKDKCWALFYWNHIARRQTAPMNIRGVDLTDPIMQCNDYGFTMCSTVSGVNTAIWDYMGLPVRYWEIGLHTVSEVKYDERYHLYDNSLSAIYTLCDGKTIAGVEDVGAEGACELSGGVREQGHIAKYHCLSGTSLNGYLTGADTNRTLASEANSFNPKIIKYQYFYKCAEWGHRYILNLREGEIYTRYYHRLDGAGSAAGKAAKKDFVNDAAYYVPKNRDSGKPYDCEAANPRYRIRGNGIREWNVPLTAGALAGVAYSVNGVEASGSGGIAPSEARKAGAVVFKVEGANVIASMKIRAMMVRATGEDEATIAVSADEGRTWKSVYSAEGAGESSAALNLIDEMNGAYDVLVKVQLLGKNKAADAMLKSIAFETITQVNSKTQPKLNVGKNTVYVGAGEQTETIVFTPDLRKGKYEQQAAGLKNLTSVASPDYGRYALLYIEDAAVPKGWVDFKVDSPTDITSITYGGRMCIRAPKSGVELSHSFDDGKTWIISHEYSTTEAPWDQTHYNTISEIPAGTRSVKFRYFLHSNEGTPAMCGLYSVRMEVQHKMADAAGTGKAMEVTFNWQERQEDYSLVKRSHTQLVEKLPATYTIDVGGADHPVMESLTVNLKGARADVTYGYSDGKDVGGEKFVGVWATYGKNLALKKPYTVSIPSGTNWESGDPEGTKLTDGRVGSSYGGGTAYREGLIWNSNATPEIVVDLGSVQKCAAFRIHTHGYEGVDAIKGQNKDVVEVLTSSDGKTFASAGFFDFNLRWKDIPVNYMWTDEETFYAHNFFFAPKVAVEARYVKYKIKSPRMINVTEVQVLDGFEMKPFDLKIALPGDRVTAAK